MVARQCFACTYQYDALILMHCYLQASVSSCSFSATHQFMQPCTRIVYRTRTRGSSDGLQVILKRYKCCATCSIRCTTMARTTHIVPEPKVPLPKERCLRWTYNDVSLSSMLHQTNMTSSAEDHCSCKQKHAAEPFPWPSAVLVENDARLT